MVAISFLLQLLNAPSFKTPPMEGWFSMTTFQASYRPTSAIEGLGWGEMQEDSADRLECGREVTPLVKVCTISIPIPQLEYTMAINNNKS